MARRHRTPAGRRSLDSLSDFISDLRGIGEGAPGDPSACGVGFASDPVLGLGGALGMGMGGAGFRGAFHSSLDGGHAAGMMMMAGRALDGYGPVPGAGPLSHRSSTGSLPLGSEGGASGAASLGVPEGGPYSRFLDPRRGAFGAFGGPGTGPPEARGYPTGGGGVGGRVGLGGRVGVGVGGGTDSGGATRGLLDMLHYGDPRQLARQGDPQGHQQSLLPSAGRFPCAAGASASPGAPPIRLKVRMGGTGSSGGEATSTGPRLQEDGARELPFRDTDAAGPQSLAPAAIDGNHNGNPSGPSLALPPSHPELNGSSVSPGGSTGSGAGRNVGPPRPRRLLLGAGSRGASAGAGEVGGLLGQGGGARTMGGPRRPLGPGMVRKAVLGKRPFSAYSGGPGASAGAGAVGIGGAGAGTGTSGGGVVSATMRPKGLLSSGRRPVVKRYNPLNPLSLRERVQKGLRAVPSDHQHAKKRALPALLSGTPSGPPGMGARARPGGGGAQGACQLSLAELMPPPPPRPPKPAARLGRAAGVPRGRGRRPSGPPLLSRQRIPPGRSATSGAPPVGPTASAGCEDWDALGDNGMGPKGGAEGGVSVPLATALVQTKAAAEAALRAVGLAGFISGAGAQVPQGSPLWGPRHTAGAGPNSGMPGGSGGPAGVDVGVGLEAAAGAGVGACEGGSLADAFGVPRELQGEFLAELVAVARVRCLEREVAGAAREFVAQRQQLLEDFCTELLRLHSSERFAMVPSADPPALLLPAVGTRAEVVQAVLQYCSHSDNLQSLCLWLCHLDRPNSLAGTCSAAVAVDRAQGQLAEDSHPSTTSLALRRAQVEAPLTVLLQLHREWDAATMSHQRELSRAPVPPFLVSMPS